MLTLATVMVAVMGVVFGLYALTLLLLSVPAVVTRLRDR